MAGAHEHASVGRVPFWLHQLVELLLGVLLLVEGARTGEHTAVVVSMGAVLLLLALCSDGALGAWPWIGRRLHRVLDVVVAIGLAVSPLVLGLDRAIAIVILEVAALAMAWLAFRTDWRPRRRAANPPPPVSSPSTASAPRPATTPPASAPPPSAADAAPLARKLGAAAGKVRDDGPRTLGRWVGRARDATRAARMAPEKAPEQAPEEPPDPPAAGGG
jgi:hypothetical protein